MQRRCSCCGVGFEARRSDAKFCSEKCRKQSGRVGEATEKSSGIESQVRTSLSQARMLDSVLGQQALELARRMGSPQETGSAAASISKELREVMAAIENAKPAEVDPVEALRNRAGFKVVSS